jgi:hypothetical protein
MDVNTTTGTKGTAHRDKDAAAGAQPGSHDLQTAISTLPLLPLLAHLGPLDVGVDAASVWVDVVVIGAGQVPCYGYALLLQPALVLIDRTGRWEHVGS